jgi:XTP/dITP diphosphohydrolase
VNQLVIATKNSGKVIEIQSGLGELAGWALEILPPDVPGVEETGSTFVANAVLKAEHYSRFGDALTLADDSGLCVSALGGRPGIHSARFAETRMARMQRVLQEMEGINDDRSAAFYCALALAKSGKVMWTVERDAKGVIAHAPSGTGGFGYDPIFWLPELHCTMAELDTESKNKLSARGRALAELRKFLISI